MLKCACRLAGQQRARDVVRACLETLTILPVDHAILTAAFALGGSDFEDDVQIAAAQAHGLDAIVTRDTGGFRDSPMPIFSPAQLIARLSP